MPEELPREFRMALARTAARRGPFGEPAIYFQEAASTNDIALALAERGAPEGAMVLASSQTAGRGRMGRPWFSPPGSGLYVSIVCRDPRAAPMLTLAGGVAVAEGIQNASGLPVSLKWPNDIVVTDAVAASARRKLAGILAEGSSGPDGLHYVVLGIGINLRPAAYPPDLAPRVTSLEVELGREVDDGAVLAEILCALNQHVGTLAAGNPVPVLERWRALAPSATGARVEWAANGDRRVGVTAGIDDTGALMVRTRDGIERIVSGEIQWL